jgi:hypothetical protein
MLKILKLIIAAWIIFAFIAVANNGGYKIRAMEDGTHKAVSKTINVVADKADSLKEQADTAKDTVKNITRGKKEIAQTDETLVSGKNSKIR